jgi:pyruvate oxidase
MSYYKCTLCEWVYDESKEGTPFAELPDDYTCPICGATKDMFVEVNQ